MKFKKITISIFFQNDQLTVVRAMTSIGVIRTGKARLKPLYPLAPPFLSHKEEPSSLSLLPTFSKHSIFLSFSDIPSSSIILSLSLRRRVKSAVSLENCVPLCGRCAREELTRDKKRHSRKFRLGDRER